MTSHSGCGGHLGHRGGGRGRGGGGGRGLNIGDDDRPPLPRPPNLYFTHGMIDLPTSDRSQGPVPNIVIFFPCINLMFTYYTRIICNLIFIQCRFSII